MEEKQERELLLHELDAFDPIVEQVIGMFSVRYHLGLEEAKLLLLERCPDPDARHDYCAQIIYDHEHKAQDGPQA